MAAAVFKFPFLPHEIFSATQTPTTTNSDPFEGFKSRLYYSDPCRLRLQASLSPTPSSQDSTISIHLKIHDNTKLILHSKRFVSGKRIDYAFKCPLTKQHFVCAYTTKHSRIRPLKIRTQYPVKNVHLQYFQSQITGFISEILFSLYGAKYDISIDAAASIERDVRPGETMSILKKIECEGRRMGSGEVCDCTVCLDQVVLRRFDGVRMPCDHAFHVKCISPWLEKKNTCPMCRRVLF